jgi:2-dehydropantoate 2-reductase
LKVLVLGTGGVGGYFGGRLVESGATVIFLVRPERKAQLEAHGLRIKSRLGDATLSVDARLKSEIGSDYDLVLLACKAYDLGSAIESIAPAMAGSAGVLAFLNGIAHLDVLNRHFGEDRVLGGTAKIAVTLTRDGVIDHLNDWCTITFGEQRNQVSSRVVELKSLFDKTSVDARVSQDIRRDLWLKLVHLHTVASMTSLMRANVGEIVSSSGGAELFQRVLETNIAIATREGYTPDVQFIANYRSLFSQSDSTYEASLLRDIEQGRLIESDHILGFMLERCRAHGFADHLHMLAFLAAKAYETRRSRGR